jgi:hypothetical protein
VGRKTTLRIIPGSVNAFADMGLPRAAELDTEARVAAAEKVAAMETERFFEERRNRADRQAFRRILDRKGGEPPRPEDTLD